MRRGERDDADGWGSAEGGDARTARALQSLAADGWVGARAIARDGGEVDLLAVGPAGVFLLASRELDGPVELHGGVPWLERRHEPPACTSLPALRPGARDAASRLARELAAGAAGQSLGGVRAVVVLWAQMRERLLEDEHGVLIDGRDVSEWLRAQPALLDAAALRAVVAAVELLAARRGPGAVRGARG